MKKGPRTHEETLLLFPAERDASVEARCPVCREGLEAVACRLCPKCDTPHHAACWEYLGSCAVFACGGKTPPRTAPVRNVTTRYRGIPDVMVIEESVRRPPPRRIEDRAWNGSALVILCLVFVGTLLPMGASFLKKSRTPVASMEESTLPPAPDHSWRLDEAVARAEAERWKKMNEPRESRGAQEFWLRDS